MYFRQILYSLFRTHARSISASQKPLLHRRPRIGLERNNVLARPSYLFAVQSLQVFAIFILPVLKPKDPWLLNPQLTCFERSALFYSFPGLEVIVVRHRRCGGCGISAASIGVPRLNCRPPPPSLCLWKFTTLSSTLPILSLWKLAHSCSMKMTPLLICCDMSSRCAQQAANGIRRFESRRCVVAVL